MTEQEIRNKAEETILKHYGFTGDAELQSMINLFIDGYSEAIKQINLSLGGVSVSLPHEDAIDSAIDKLLIIRGEHHTRVRNPIYGEERQLARDLVKFILLNER